MKKYIYILFFLVVYNAYSQYYYFGRNKVQYTDFKWQVLQTEHFEIFFYPEMKTIAEIGATFAEESYSILQVKFNHNVQRKIPLVFYSTHQHFEQTNITSGFIPEGVGGFFEFMKGRVVIPFMGSISQFKHVIRHELVHVFMHSKITRVLKDHRIPLERYPPLWFVEGLAEYWSTEWDDQAEMVLRDAVLQDYMVGLDNIEQISGSFAMYKIGQHVLGYIAQKFGDEQILLLMENLWKGKTFKEVFKITIGKDFEEFDKMYLMDLKKKYFPFLTLKEQSGIVAKTIQAEGYNLNPIIYKHGDTTETIFIGNLTGYTSIYIKELYNNGNLEKLIQGEKSSDFEAFHLQSSKISINNNGELAFATKSGENDVLYIFDVKTEKIIKSVRDDDLVLINSPSWSNDGKYIVFTGVNKGGFSDLYILNLMNDEIARLTNDLYDDRDPVFSPDGKKILFSSDRSSTKKYNLFLYDIESKVISYLTFGNENYYSPNWPVDGGKIFFTTDIDGVLNVWAMDSTQYNEKKIFQNSFFKREIRKITDFTTSVYDPFFFDSDKIIFSSFEKFKFKICLLDGIKERFDTSKFLHTCDLSSIGNNWVIDTKEIIENSKISSYKESYNLDIAASQVSTDPIFGTNAGAVLAFSDLLGNDQYYFLLYNNAQTKDEILESFNIAISRISLHKRMNYAYGIFNFSGRRYDLMDVDEFYWERVFGGYFVLSYPLSVFQRIEASTQISNSDKDNYYKERKALMVSNSISFISDNSMWSSTGPIDGHRAFVSLSFTSDIKHSNVNYYTIMADYRHYFRLSTRSAFASRIQLYWNEGKEARRYLMGGSWDLRGYPRWSLRGQKLWLTSHELRFPLIDAIGVKFPFGGIGFGAFRGALFFDAGSVWDSKYKDTKGSFGLGLRFNFLGAIVFRYDMGYKIIDNFKRVDNRLFYQFFFGWDF
ncbi:MAG TPA: BamA/TamA family outer membrane protein [Bacteroidota bacterium]|nr:BamA/TamA family outer membrane protein [Bacteroidota bacterium]